MTARRSTPLEVAGRVAVVAMVMVVDLTIWNENRQLRGGGELSYAVIPVLTVLVHATLLIRHRYPRSALACEWAFALVGSLAVPLFQPIAGPLLGLHAVGSRRPQRESALWLAALAPVFGVYSSNTAAASPGDARRDFALMLMLWLLIASAVWAVGRRHYVSARRAWRLRELQAAEAADAVRAERLQLARELHDTVSHAVTGMMLQAAGAQQLLRPSDERVRASLTVIETSGIQAMSELHRMLGLLHASGPETGAVSAQPGPAVADITTLVRLAEDAGRNVRLVQVGTPTALDPSVETAAYRVVQEALTNSSKYAGWAAEVTVELGWHAQLLQVTVTDRSRGRPRECQAHLSSGRGLPGLTERITLIGGTLTSGPTVDGFTLKALLPGPATRPALAAMRAAS